MVAGGRSARMGRDKAALPWGGGDLLDHAVATLSAVTGDVRILCGPDMRYEDRGRPVIADAVADVGGLAALVTALRALEAAQTAVLIAVDLPLVRADLLRELLARSEGWDVVVPVSPSGAEPFAAVYRASCREAVEQACAEGRLKMTAFWRDVRVREVPAQELSAFGDPAQVFCNVNTPGEYARAKALAGA